MAGYAPTTKLSGCAVLCLLVSLSRHTKTKRQLIQFLKWMERLVLLQSRFDIQDMWLPGKGKQPDQAFRPDPRPENPAMAALIQMRPVLGRPWPTIMLEVGNSQDEVPQLVDIRNRALGWKTQINVFIGIAYNRNQTRATDSWWACQCRGSRYKC
jgi:hypothetical protein